MPLSCAMVPAGIKTLAIEVPENRYARYCDYDWVRGCRNERWGKASS
jgi:hypothetical protein